MPTQDWSRSHKTRRGKDRDSANSISIAAIVTHYGGEVREGKSVAVRCCIHNDSRRSAVINTYDNLYYCHTCGKGGNAVSVVMEIENLGYKDGIARAREIVNGSGISLQPGNKRGNSKVSRRTWNI